MSKEKENRTELLRKIKDEVVDLKESPLYQYRIENKYFPVIGEGDHYTNIMLVGEAPGQNEAKTGRPFCGAAGRMLDHLLNSVGIDRKSVYITNILKDRPPGNRDPLPHEISLYGSFLRRQVEIIRPKVIATLGRFSMRYIFDMFEVDNQDSISKTHGKKFEADTSYGNIVILPLYHPAVAIYNQSQKEVLEKDFEMLKEYK